MNGRKRAVEASRLDSVTRKGIDVTVRFFAGLLVDRWFSAVEFKASSLGVNMTHWINRTPMAFFVGKRSGLVTECCPMYSNIEGSFRSEVRAIEFAKALHDGLNFIMVYGDNGRVVHIFGPGLV